MLTFLHNYLQKKKKYFLAKVLIRQDNATRSLSLTLIKKPERFLFVSVPDTISSQEWFLCRKRKHLPKAKHNNINKLICTYESAIYPFSDESLCFTYHFLSCQSNNGLVLMNLRFKR